MRRSRKCKASNRQNTATRKMDKNDTQKVRSQESAIMSYKIANLLQFYKITMTKTIGDEAVLSVTLKEYVDISVC